MSPQTSGLTRFVRSRWSLSMASTLSTVILSVPIAYAESAMTCQVSIESGQTVMADAKLAGEATAPETSTGYRLGLTPVESTQAMVVSANPYASQAGCDVLLNGGSAIDAAVAVQLTLGLVEPQSSGLGGGGFLLYFDAKTNTLTSYDGRETAPAQATPDYLRYIEANNPDSGAPKPNARRSGRSIGTPGVVRMLEMVHQQYGVLPWSTLGTYPHGLAIHGFKVSPRLSSIIDSQRDSLSLDSDARAYFLDAQGQALSTGTVLVNPAYASTLEAIATQGANALYQGPIAQAIIEKIHQTRSMDGQTQITPGMTSLDDLANYQPIERPVICTQYRHTFEVCGMAPPSSGGIAIAQALGILESFDLSRYRSLDIDIYGGRPSPASVHLISEVLNLVFADRNQYVADMGPAFNQGMQLPTTAQLLDASYLRQRAGLIRLDQPSTKASPGQFDQVTAHLGSSSSEGYGTTHISIVDANGNAVSFTTTVESAFGSYHMTNGFLLNNQLTDFSAQPQDEQGPIANRIEANKRPRSSMSPTLVFRLNDQGQRSELFMVTGSPGGAAIIQYTLKTLIGVLDWELDAQQATSLMNFGGSNAGKMGDIPPITLEADFPNFDYQLGNREPLVLSLQTEFARPASSIKLGSLNSGVSTIVVRKGPEGQFILQGGVDPRREGQVLGF